MTGCLSLKIIVGLICGHYRPPAASVGLSTDFFVSHDFSKMDEVPMYTAIWQE